MKRKRVLMIIAAATFCLCLHASAEAHPASGIVVDRAGNVYFSDLETIWKFDKQGKLTVFRAGERGRHVHELSINDEGNIYGADVSYNPSTKGWISDVWKMTPEGKFAYLLEPTEAPPRGMSIWRDRAGNMYWIDQNNHTKRETLLLRRTPDGVVTTLAGSAYGHMDGKGVSARFSSVGGMTFGPDGSLYLTDGAFVRKVTMDGTVTTVASNLNFRTTADKPRLFGGLSGNLAGLAVDSNCTIYVADSENRRLLKVTPNAPVEIKSRAEPPYFPTGVAAVGGEVFVLEVGFTLPNLSSGPRVRKITAAGKDTILITVGAPGNGNAKVSLAEKAGITAETALVFASRDGRLKYSIAFASLGIVSVIAVTWRRRRRTRV
jgi:hypothetical protein